MCFKNTEKPIGKSGCLGIYSKCGMVGGLAKKVAKRRGKEDNKQVLRVRDDRECYELGKYNEFGEFNRYKISSYNNNLYFGRSWIGF
jgi:hypothetical protein